MHIRSEFKSGRRTTTAGLLAFGVLQLAFFAGCGERRETKPDRTGIQALFSVGTANLPLRKESTDSLPQDLCEIYCYAGGIRVPVLHVNIKLAPPNPQELRKVLLSNPAKPGEIVIDSSNPWAQNSAQSFFNCHAFALGETVGLTPNDQINGAPVRTLGFPNPVGELLPVFFTLKLAFEGHQMNLANIESDSRLSTGDRIFFVAKTKEGVEHVHSGRIVKRGQENWVMSKLGEDPLVITPLETLSKLYDFSQIQIWIPRSN